MKNNLADRIDTMLCGRKIHAWGKAIGLSRSVLQALKNGKLPGADKLGPIIRSENLSLSWLLEGIGKPYLINSCGSDEECSELITELLQEQWQRVYLLTDGAQVAAVLTQPGGYDYSGVNYLYTIVEVVCGVLGQQTLSIIQQQVAPQSLHYLRISSNAMRQLTRGQLGTYKLLNAPEALLKQTPSQEDDTGAAILEHVAEPATPYHGGGEVSSDELATIEDLRQLERDNLAHIRAVIRSLAASTNKQAE